MTLLVNNHEEKVLTFDNNGTPTFHHEDFELDLRITGVAIPPLLQKEYSNQNKVLTSSPLFKKAFIELYFPEKLKNLGWKLQDRV